MKNTIFLLVHKSNIFYIEFYLMGLKNSVGAYNLIVFYKAINIGLFLKTVNVFQS